MRAREKRKKKIRQGGEMPEKQVAVQEDAEFVTVAEAVRLTRSSEPTIRRKLTEGELRRYKFGGRTLIKRSELLGLIREA